MHAVLIFALSFAAVVPAATPPGFAPSSTGELTITYGNTLTVGGIDIPKSSAQQPPTVGTAMQLSGSYSIVMVDPDLPPNVDGTSRGPFLHWMQTDLVSSNTVTVVGGRPIFPMVAGPLKTPAIAAYTPPSPPAAVPFTHRYVLMVVNTTGNQPALMALSMAGQTRLPFNPQAAMQAAGLNVLAANWFTVSNGTSGTVGGALPSQSGAVATGTGVGFQSVADMLRTPGVLVTGLGLFIGYFL